MSKVCSVITIDFGLQLFEFERALVVAIKPLSKCLDRVLFVTPRDAALADLVEDSEHFGYIEVAHAPIGISQTKETIRACAGNSETFRTFHA